jgi:hypothetical protein
MLHHFAHYFRRQVALPQDYGSWVFILSPLLIGLFAGESFTPASINMILSAIAAFLLRQPVTVAVKAYSGRRPRQDLPAARFWMTVYGVIILLALAGLVREGFGYLLYLAIPGIPIFVWHLYLVSKRAERRQAGVEILATGALSLAATAAYWIGERTYDPLGWVLWILVWLQSAASIVYAYLRLAQRALSETLKRAAQLQMGRRAMLYTTFNLTLTLGLGFSSLLPPFLFLPYLLQWFETLWGTLHPAIGLKPTAIGIRQLIVSTLFTILFILTWRI